MPFISKFRFTLLSCLLVLAQNGCGTLAGNPEEDSASVQFFIADAPIDQLKHVYLAISSLDVLDKNGKWINTQLTESSAIDLLSYQGGSSLKFASANLPASEYQQVRLVLSKEIPPYVIEQSGKQEALKVPSGVSSGVKIHKPFTISSQNKDQPLSLVIDVDLRQSIITRGGNSSQKEKYLLKPVLRMVDKDKTGIVEGAATNDNIVCLYESGQTKDDHSDCPNAVTSVKAKNKYFKIAHIEAGNYDLRVFTSAQAYKDLTDISVTEKKSTFQNVNSLK